MGIAADGPRSDFHQYLIMAPYKDFQCAVKTANNELLATAVNSLNKAIQKVHGTPPTWYLLTFDGEHAQTTSTLHQRAGVSMANVTIVEKDRVTVKKLRTVVLACTIIESTMQRFVQSSEFIRTGGYNVVFFDWTCTTIGNEIEGSPQVALESLLRQTEHPYVVLAQTYNMRGKHMHTDGRRAREWSGSLEWIRGTDGLYEEEKSFVCSNLAERAMRCSYLPLWNLHFESMYRRPKSPSWMLFMCVVLWRIPTTEVPRHHWDLHNDNQVRVKDRYARSRHVAQRKFTIAAVQIKNHVHRPGSPSSTEDGGYGFRARAWSGRGPSRTYGS
jgi:hypothetical protein